jgi:hypothetical protein
MSVTRITSAELMCRRHAAPNVVARAGRIFGLKGGRARGGPADHPTEMKNARRFASSVSGISQG